MTLLLALYGFVAVWHEHQPAVRAYARAQTVLAGVWIAVCVLLSFAIIKVQSLVGMQCITIVRLVKETWWRNVLRCEKYVGEALVLSSSDGTLKSRTGTGDYFSISCEDKDTVRLCVRMVEPQTYTRPHLLRCTGRVCLGAELAIRRRRTRRRAPQYLYGCLNRGCCDALADAVEQKLDQRARVPHHTGNPSRARLACRIPRRSKLPALDDAVVNAGHVQ